MHRREPDDPNAKYWFAHAGRLVAFDAIAEADGTYVDPATFVDRVARARARGAADEVRLCESIQWTEWCELVRYVTD